jgi:hypothetical protein
MKKEKGRGEWNKKEIYYLFLDIVVHKFYFPFYYYIMKNKMW